MMIRPALIFLALFAPALPAQDAAYDVPGILAWTTGKTYGFTFSPEANSGESVSRPLDGMNTRLTRSTTVLRLTQTFTVAQVVGGQPSVNPGERNTTFKFFGGRTLQPGWTVKSVDVGGNFTYVDQPRLGTSDLSFRVRLAPGGSATLRKIVLNGPAGSDWKDAFSAPVRRDYVINGTVAWDAARKYGFTFKSSSERPPSGNATAKLTQTEPPDGVFTVLWIWVPRIGILNYRCTELQAKSTTFDVACIVGQIVGGNMSVPPALSRSGDAHSVAFTMFGAKKLSPGWIVKSVTTSNGSWTRQPAYGSNDLSFVLTVTSYGSNAAIAIVKSITLEGPSSAASFEDAFKNAQ
ncbi:MAG TPA: hypothetical protein VM099_12905 [Gemmatimonadaceae bacterium]|nr:hypothetical protein [Gemmatimonadaceae bacterium]